MERLHEKTYAYKRERLRKGGGPPRPEEDDWVQSNFKAYCPEAVGEGRAAAGEVWMTA